MMHGFNLLRKPVPFPQAMEKLQYFIKWFLKHWGLWHSLQTDTIHLAHAQHGMEHHIRQLRGPLAILHLVLQHIRHACLTERISIFANMITICINNAKECMNTFT